MKGNCSLYENVENVLSVSEDQMRYPPAHSFKPPPQAPRTTTTFKVVCLELFSPPHPPTPHTHARIVKIGSQI